MTKHYSKLWLSTILRAYAHRVCPPIWDRVSYTYIEYISFMIHQLWAREICISTPYLTYCTISRDSTKLLAIVLIFSFKRSPLETQQSESQSISSSEEYTVNTITSGGSNSIIINTEILFGTSQIIYSPPNITYKELHIELHISYTLY